MRLSRSISGLLGCLLLAGGPTLVYAGAHNQGGADGEPATTACPAGEEGCKHMHMRGGKHGHHHGYGRHKGGPGEKRGMFGEDMNLTEQQKQDMAALMQIYGPRLGDIRKRGQEDRERLLRMKPDDPGYADLTEDVAEEAADAAEEVVILLGELQTNAYALLTPEQQAKFAEFRNEMMDRMEQRQAERAERRKSGERPYRGYGGWYGGMKGKPCEGEDCPRAEECPNEDCPMKEDAE